MPNLHVLCLLALTAGLCAQQPAAAPTAQSPAPAAQPTLIVLNKSAASASLFDPATGKERALVAVGEGPHEVAVSPDQTLAVVCNYGPQKPGSSLTVIDLAAAKPLRTIELQREEPGSDGKPRQVTFLRPHGIEFVAERIVAVTAETTQRLLIVDLERGAVTAAIPTSQRLSHMVALSQDRKVAFTANIGSGSISQIDLAAGQFVRAIETGAGAEGIAVHHGRHEVWVANRAADTVSVVDARKGEVLTQIATGSFPIRVVLTRDGAHALVSCAKAGRIDVIDVAARKLARSIPMAATAEASAALVPVGILVAPDGKRAFVANTQADQLTVLDLVQWTVSGTIATGREPDGMAWAEVPAAAPARAK